MTDSHARPQPGGSADVATDGSFDRNGIDEVSALANVDELRDTSRRLQAALQAARVTVFEQDLELRYTWVHNPALGHSAQVVIGQRDVDLFERSDDAARTEAIKRSVMESGEGDRHEVPVYSNGVVRWYDLSVEPRRDAAGVVVGVTCAAVEVTERRKREAHLSFLSELDRALSPSAGVEEIARESARRIQDYLDLSRCVLVEIDEAAGRAHVFHDEGRPGLPSLVGLYAIADFHTEHERQQMADGRVMVVDDIGSEPRTAQAANRFRALGIAAMVNAPHVSDGRWRFVLSAMRDKPSRWSLDEQQLLNELATRTFLRLERRRAQDRLVAARQTFEHLVQNSPFGIYAVDSDFRLMLVSAGARKVFENVRPLIGRDFADVLRTLWPEPFASEVISHFRHTLATGEPFNAPSTVEKRRDTAAVEAYDWKIERVTMPDGRYGAVCHFYDLSERQRLEEDLRTLDRQRTDFLGMLAHELRNPLAPIRTAVKLMQDLDIAKSVQDQCLDIIGRQVTQMTRLLDDLLDVARLSRSQFELRRSPVRMCDVLDTALETSQPWIEQQKIEVQVRNDEPELILDADAARLTQVFANLLNNAARYSPPCSRVELLVTREGPSVTVRVRDSGVGMSSELVAHVFDLYARGRHAPQHSPGGLGIGLALARHLVELHGGHIRAHSDGDGLGSEFAVILPVPEHALQPVPVRRGDNEPRLDCRVIVVDDNLDAADTTALLLDAYGATVRTAYDGESALQEAAQFRPEIMVVDLSMPGTDGFAVCERVRSAAWGRDIVMFALSGRAQADDIHRSKGSGFDRHLVKPVDPDVMIQAIQAGLAASAQQRTGRG